MPAPRNRSHLLVRTTPRTEAYTPHPMEIKEKPVPDIGDRPYHANNLIEALNRTMSDAKEQRRAVEISVHGAKPGFYIEFQSRPNIALEITPLGNQPKDIEILAVQSTQSQEKMELQRATVFVPDKSESHFSKRLSEYANERTETGQPRHKDVYDRVETMRLAQLRSLWTDESDAFPDSTDTIWWEVWLRRDQGREIERIMEFADLMEIEVGKRRLVLFDRTIVLIKAEPSQLSKALVVLGDVAEVRRAKESADFFLDMGQEEQAEWTLDLKRRTVVAPDDAPTVCILDTGVSRGHPLLEMVIGKRDVFTVEASWGDHDNDGFSKNKGHGTEMAGLAVYGDLLQYLATNRPVKLRHSVESVKILPPEGGNNPQLYGAITAHAVAHPEIESPQRLRAYMLAVTTNDSRDRGQPTSWSAALDALAVGRSFAPSTCGLEYLDHAERDSHRLFIVSAGNVNKYIGDHLDRSDTESVQDPAQAWNVLTVGAFTEKVEVSNPHWANWSPVAEHGELSPYSTTSVSFQEKWPIKPDVVFEGGNLATNGNEFEDCVPDLCLLTTNYKPNERLLTYSNATSAATAQVARMAAIVRAEYSNYWPETVRALLVHSARWTPKMMESFNSVDTKRERLKLTRRYGYGVPSLVRALRSASDSLTLVVQSEISPFVNGKMCEMNLHELPWPSDVLSELDQQEVELRVTLSYFIEPNPARRGWVGKYRYASHGLRFDVKSPTESIDEFRKRRNMKALEEKEKRPKTGNTEGWFFGEQERSKGSLHSDHWIGSAAELAERGAICVYPVSGWWKDIRSRDRSGFGVRYALVATIVSTAENIDIWTPVAQQIGVPVVAE